VHLAVYVPPYLHRDHDAGVLVPAQQRVLSIPRLRLLDVRAPGHENFVRVGACETSGYGSIHGLDDFEVGGEEDVEVALVDL
jgi:hypothetical protein